MLLFGGIGLTTDFHAEAVRGAAATFMNLLSTHPQIEERIRLLQATRA
jgi:Zn-dependent protease with chaperone function